MPRQQATRRRKSKLTAKNADKFALYEKSVQDPDNDIDFIDRVFRKERGRAPATLREDFCGTAKLCAHWVRSKPERTAVGLDLHEPTLKYGMRKHIRPLGDAAERVELRRQDVLDGSSEKFDVIVAFNFSYSVFKERRQMLRYFQQAREALGPDGGFFIDMYGGPEAQQECEETQRIGGFTYVWDQRPLDAVNGFCKRYIHFRFPDGTAIKRAFSYDWRLWSLPELKDLFADAGFSQIDVYWEGADDEGNGNGIFRKVRRAENEEAYIAYVVGWR